MKHILTNIFISCILFLIVISFLLLNIKNNTDNNTDNKLHLYIYNIVVILFILLFLFLFLYNGYTKGLVISIFIWAFFVTCTPIPEAGLLVTLPLKRYFSMSIHTSQIIVSIVGLLILFYFLTFKLLIDIGN